MEKKVEVDRDHAVYRCPSCEHFFLVDGWSEDNDICKLCLEGFEMTPEEEDEEEHCFFCERDGNDCICDATYDFKIEQEIMDDFDNE